MKKSKKKYELGSYIKPLGATGQGIAAGGQLLGSMIGGNGGNIISGVASGAMMGGPLGAAIGGLGAVVGNIVKKKADTRQKNLEYQQYNSAYQEQLRSNQDTINENPYGQVFADGGIIPDPNMLYRLQKGVKYQPIGRGYRNSKTNPTSEEKYINYSKGKKSVDPFGEMLDAPQKAATWALTGNYQKPSEAMSIQNKWGATAVDTVLDPMNALFFLKMAKATKAIEAASQPKIYRGLNLAHPRTVRRLQGGANQTKLVAGALDVNSIYGGLDKYAEGGEVFPNLINIEKGELQIDPKTGKILREYTGINPETGGLYKPHSKGKDTSNNFVSAEPGTFVITSKKAKDYKDALDQNDKLRQNTILKNIINYKDSKEAKTDKFALGSYVDGDVPPLLRKQISPYDNLQSQLGFMTSGNMGVLPQLPTNAPTSTGVKLQGYTGGIKPSNTVTPSTSLQGNTNKGSLINTIGQGIGTYGNALYNIGQGMFGKVDKVNQIGITQNPYKQDILNNMPQDINFEPVRQQLLRQQNTAFNQIDNTTNGSPIARANKLNVFANTQNQLGSLMMDNQVKNNQVRGQRASIYGNLANQEMNESNRVQQLNLGIDEQNRANKGAKQNMLSTGLTQLQQAYQNNRANNSKAAMDKYKIDLLKQMFPNLKYYGNQFDYDSITGG